MLGGDLRCKCYSLIPPSCSYCSAVHLERLGSLSEDCIRFYVAQLSSALSCLHEMGIMHRYASASHFRLNFPSLNKYFYSDIKPDNILLDERGNAHLTDFNIAVHFGERKLTGVAGSMAYMAPEYVFSTIKQFHLIFVLFKDSIKTWIHVLYRLVVVRRLCLRTHLWSTSV